MDRKRFFISMLLIFVLFLTGNISAQTETPDNSPKTDSTHRLLNQIAEASEITAEEIIREYLYNHDLPLFNDPDNPIVLDGVCYVNQSTAYYLYKDYQDDPESLTETEKKMLGDMIMLLERSGFVEEEDDLYYIMAIAAASGCGYAFPAEIILDMYKDKPEIFENDYGYPLYYSADGEIIYNLDTLFLDIFLRINTEKIRKIIPEKDNIRYLLTLFGLSMYQTDIQFDEMDDVLHAVLNPAADVLTLQRNVSYKTYNKYLMKGKYDYACIALHTFKLRPYGSNPREDDYISDGGHWMRIKGITENKHYIVTSWGDEWELLNYSPYLEGKTLFFFQPKNDNDGGLIFIDTDL